MRKLLTLTAILSAFSTSALADTNTIFSCTTENGDRVFVKKDGSNYLFSFKGVSFKEPIKQSLANPNSEIAIGSGFITSSLELKQNSNMSYTVSFTQPKNNLKEYITPSVSMYPNGQLGDYFECNMQKPFEEHLDRNSMRTQ